MITPAMAMRRHLRFLVREAFRQVEPHKPPLILSPYLMAMCYSLEQTLHGEIKRLVINVLPRYGKSITAAVAFCAWLLGQNPRLKILVATYNEDLARLHDQQLRQLMESPAYRAAFPGTVIDRKRTRQLEIYTTAGGSRMAVTTGGSATGYGGDYIILDDCIKAQDASSDAERQRVEQWYRGTIGTRLNSKMLGVIISIQQRLHERDLAALILEDGATHLNLPVIAVKHERIAIGPGRFYEREPGDLLAPEHENWETVQRQKRQMGRRNFALQYMQDPTPEGGNIVRPEWFLRYDEVLPRWHYLKLILSWDTAYGIDPGTAYSVCTVWG